MGSSLNFEGLGAPVDVEGPAPGAFISRKARGASRD